MVRLEISGAADLAAVIEGKSDDEINDALQGEYEATCQQVIDAMKDHFLPERAGNASAVIQYDVRAPDAVHTFQLSVADGQCNVTKGAPSPARVTLALALPDFLRLVSGSLEGMQAFFSGRLKLTGDMMFAQTMQSWFKPSRPTA